MKQCFRNDTLSFRTLEVSIYYVLRNTDHCDCVTQLRDRWGEGRGGEEDNFQRALSSMYLISLPLNDVAGLLLGRFIF